MVAALFAAVVTLVAAAALAAPARASVASQAPELAALWGVEDRGMDPGLSGVTPQQSRTREVRVGIWTYPPQISRDESGHAQGIFADIIEHVAAQNGWKLTYVYGTWEDNLRWLEKGEVDLGVGIGQVPKREAQFDLNEEPVLSDWGQIYTRKDDRIETIGDLEGKTVIGWRDDETYLVLQRIASGLGVHATYLASNSAD